MIKVIFQIEKNEKQDSFTIFFNQHQRQVRNAQLTSFVDTIKPEIIILYWWIEPLYCSIFSKKIFVISKNRIKQRCNERKI